MARGAIDAALLRRMDRFRNRLALAAGTLDAVSPLATLQRGYAIVTTEEGRVVTESNALAVGSHVHGRLAHGTFRARVEQTWNGNDSDSTS